jgi:glycosyltransferase involved in cell wall biosynthesis
MFSIVIPLYNKKELVESSIRSVQQQTFRDFEAIIIDDGSTDGSAEVAQAAIAGDERFVMVRQPNAGVSATRNRAVEMASRDWIAFFDADDLWSEDHLAVAANILARHPDTSFYSSAYQIVKRDEVLFDSTRSAPLGACRVNEGFFENWIRLNESPVATSSTIVSRLLLIAAGAFPTDLALGEDLLTWMKLLECGKYILNNTPTVLMRHDDSHSLSRAPSIAAIKGHNRLIEVLEDMAEKRTELNAIARRHRRIHCYMLMQSGNRRELMRFLASYAREMDPRTLAMATLELAGLRSRLREAYRRFGQLRLRPTT